MQGKWKERFIGIYRAPMEIQTVIHTLRKEHTSIIRIVLIGKSLTIEMDPTRINWSRRIAVLISEDSDIPTDVTFKFVKSNNGDGEVTTPSNDGDVAVATPSNDDADEVSAPSNDGADEVSAPSNDGDVAVAAPSNDDADEVSAPSNDGADEVSAHKMILALVSPVLRKMFYVHNTVDMFAQEIIIEETTAPAFRIFIDAIYGVNQIQESLKGKSVDEIFAVLYLVTKYDIPELVLAVQDTLSSFPLTDDTVLEVAGDGMDYSSTFQEGANLLLLACAKFLKAKLTQAGDVFRLIAENGDRLAVIHRLTVLIREITPPDETISIPDLVESSGEESDYEDNHFSGEESDYEDSDDGSILHPDIEAIMAILDEDSDEDLLPVPPLEMD